MYFLSKCFRFAKASLAVIGTLMSTGVIVYGVVTSGGAIYIVGGGFYLATSLFLGFDSSKVLADIRKQIDILKTDLDLFDSENRQLCQNIDHLKQVKENFVKENRKLHSTLEQTEEHMRKLKHLKDELEENIEAEKDELTHFSVQNEELSQKLEQINQLKEAYQQENEQLQTLLDNGQNQIGKLEQLKIEYASEILILRDDLQLTQQNNYDLKDQVKEMDVQLEKLRKLYQDTKQLMYNLSQAGDIFNQFSTSIDTSVVKLDTTQDDLDETARQLKQLVEKLKDQTFEEIDLDQDGKITKDEFQRI